MASMAAVVVVQDADGARRACAALSGRGLLAFDMEGVNLGRDGEVTLVQLSGGDGKVYCFDLLRLGAEGFAPAAALLSSQAVCKLCYDCRCDGDALLHLLGVRLACVYDLQVAYTLLFQPRSDPFLKGLHRALAAPGVVPDPAALREALGRKLAYKAALQQSGGSDIFRERPLTAQMLLYCAGDVQHLFSMHWLWSPHLQHGLVLALSAARMQRFIACGPAAAEALSLVDFMPLPRELRQQRRPRRRSAFARPAVRV